MRLAAQGGKSFTLAGNAGDYFFSVAYVQDNNEVVLSDGRRFFIVIDRNGDNRLEGRWMYNNSELATLDDIQSTDVNVHAGGGQTIYFQVYNGHLEYKLSDGSYTALANA